MKHQMLQSDDNPFRYFNVKNMNSLQVWNRKKDR